MKNLFQEFEQPSGEGSTVERTSPTAEEKARRERLQELRDQRSDIEASIKQLVSRCREEGHRVRYDVPGYTYDIRTCWVCGCGLGWL